MTTLKVGIVSYEEMKARTMAVAAARQCVFQRTEGLVHFDRILRQGVVRMAIASCYASSPKRRRTPQ